MGELFDDEEDKVLIAEDEVDVEVEDIEEEVEEASVISQDNQQPPLIDARRRLENLLEEKRLRDELEDFFDF